MCFICGIPRQQPCISKASRRFNFRPNQKVEVRCTVALACTPPQTSTEEQSGRHRIYFIVLFSPDFREVMEQPLSLWEAVCLGMNVTLAFELEGPVTPENICLAFKAVAAEYIYLRSVVSFRSADFGRDWFFVEKPEQDVQLKVFPEQTVDWETRIQQMANTPRDHTRSLTWMELYSQGGRHQLFATVSHAGMDGTGLFFMFHRLFEQLGMKTLPDTPHV